jgi:uncharacterized membrane protein
MARAATRLVGVLPRLVRLLARHWLALANLVLGLQATLPFLAPSLMHSGYTRAGYLLYRIYGPLCHQLPERSFFLFGPRWTYSLEDLVQRVGSDVPLRFVGDASVGFKTTVCQRDVATYLAMWAAGLLFVLCRRRLRPLSLKVFVLLCLPIAVDGFGQLLTLWDSNSFSRTITGALFGLACIWLAFPIVESSMSNLQLSLDSEHTLP